ncbi:acylneuraminate cytidylyltransferase family protein [Candidatus Pacearchaeota archaeon]|nr:acylneuraminate cytidylyltransferase family protein [Candidatus Pacearchaeota archaeon]
MNMLLTVCCRGGSKGVKNKNIRNLAGKPLIAYTLETAKKWGKADTIICSTDSKAVADVAKEYGVEIPFMRPKSLATDTMGKIPVIRHALIESEKIYDTKFDIIVDLDVTNPIRTIEDLNNCLKIFQEKDIDFLLSAVKARKNPYMNMLEIKKDGLVTISKRLERPILRRQDAPKVYSANASIYFYRREFLLDEKSNWPLSSNRVIIYLMNEWSAVDIDTELDFRFIEFLIKDRLVSI